MIGVAERDECGGYAAFCGQFLGWSGEDEKRFAARFFLDVDVAPAHRFANAGAERFGDGFFSCKPRSQMASGKFHRHRILNFAIGENAMKKAFAKTIDRVLDARAFHQVDANAEHTHSKFTASAGVPRFVLHRRELLRDFPRSRSTSANLTALNGQVGIRSA